MQLAASTLAAAATVMLATTACVHAAPIPADQRPIPTLLSARTSGARLLDLPVDALDMVRGFVGHTAGGVPTPRLEPGSTSTAALSLSVKGKGKKAQTKRAKRRAEWTQEELELLQLYRRVPIDKVDLNDAKKAILIDARRKNENEKTYIRVKRWLGRMNEEELEQHWKNRRVKEVARKARRGQAALPATAEMQELPLSQHELIRKPENTVRQGVLDTSGEQDGQVMLPISAGDERQFTQPLIRPSAAAATPTPEPYLTLALNGPTVRSAFRAPPKTLNQGDGLDLTLAPPEPRQ